MDDLITSLSTMTVNDVSDFKVGLKGMSKKQLNNLDETKFDKPLRKYVHEERVCRKQVVATTSTSTTTAATATTTTPITTNPTTRSRTQSRRQKQKTKPIVEKYSLYPSLHPLITAHCPNQSFHPHDTDNGMTTYHDSFVVGSFTCSNTSCKKRWNSMVVTITIRQYGRRKYNARVYYQRCDVCDSLAKPDVDEEVYTERVVYRLRKWEGYRDEVPIDYIKKERRGPHDEERCEGCLAGHCVRGKTQKSEF